MDFGTSIIGIMFLLFCCIIFVILSRSNRKQEQKLLQSLKRTAEQNNCRIDLYDSINNAAIGIDKKAGIIFFARNTGSNLVARQVNLSETDKCEMIIAVKTVNDGDGKYKIIEKAELAFNSRNRSEPEIILDFYNAATDGPALNREVLLVEKWCKMINEKFVALSLQKQ